MNAFSSNRVGPIVRVLAGIIGVALALAGLLGLVLLGWTVWDGLRTRHIVWKLVAIGILLPLGACSVARIFLEVAVTGENPRIDEEDEPELNPPAI